MYYFNDNLGNTRTKLYWDSFGLMTISPDHYIVFVMPRGKKFGFVASFGYRCDDVQEKSRGTVESVAMNDASSTSTGTSNYLIACMAVCFSPY